MPRRNMRRESYSVYLETETLEKLRTLSCRTMVPVSAYIRKGVDHIIAKNLHIIDNEAFDDQ